MRGATELLRLQRQAGNAAVSGAIQRQPAGKPDFTQDKVDLAGDGVIRREVHGLTFGLSGGHQSSYKGDASFEAKKTDRSPEHMAVVIVPAGKITGPVQVILHFHGFGYRGGDPYAGYLVASGGGGSTKSPAGTTRDYHQENWEQQTGAVGKERVATGGPAIVTILAQGRGKSEFGQVPTFEYIADVFSKVPELKGVTDYTLIQTAHSGGGYKLRTEVNEGRAATADRGKLPAAKDGKAAPQPAEMVVMFDAEAMDDKEYRRTDPKTSQEKVSKVPGIASWAKGHVRRLDKQIRAALAAGRPADAQAAIKATPKLRAYFAASGGYASIYTAADREIGRLIDKIPTPYGNPDTPAVAVADLFRFVPIAGVRHEFVISKGAGGNEQDGAMADALRASIDPTSDRAQALPRATKGSKAPTPKVVPPAPQPAAPTPGPAPQPAAPTPGPATQPAAPTPGPAPVSAAARPAPAAARRSPAAPQPVAAAAAPATTAAPKGWRASSASSEYLLTQQQRDELAAQTPEQRAADAKELKSKLKRIKKLTAAEKKAAKAKTEMPEADKKELADLRTLAAKVAAASKALKQSDVEDILAAAGHTVDGWYGDVQKGTFLNVNVRVHKNLAAALQRAEATLVGDPTTNPDGLDAVALGKQLGMSPRASDMRIPKAAVGGTSISMHTFGLAVDLNYAGNPYLALNGRTAPDVILRASSLVNNAPVDVGKHIGGTKEAYDKMTAASRALATYLSFKDEANRAALRTAIGKHTAASGEPVDEAGWVKQIEDDHKAITGSKDFKGHTSPEKGFMDFEESVVMALAGAGLTWGGTYSSTKDLMHFDLRSGEGAKVDSARNKHKANK